MDKATTGNSHQERKLYFIISRSKQNAHFPVDKAELYARHRNLEIPAPKEGAEAYCATHTSSGKQNEFTVQGHPQIAQK